MYPGTVRRFRRRGRDRGCRKKIADAPGGKAQRDSGFYIVGPTGFEPAISDPGFVSGRTAVSAPFEGQFLNPENGQFQGSISLIHRARAVENGLIGGQFLSLENGQFQGCISLIHTVRVVKNGLIGGQFFSPENGQFRGRISLIHTVRVVENGLIEGQFLGPEKRLISGVHQPDPYGPRGRKWTNRGACGGVPPMQSHIRLITKIAESRRPRDVLGIYRGG